MDVRRGELRRGEAVVMTFFPEKMNVPGFPEIDPVAPDIGLQGGYIQAGDVGRVLNPAPEMDQQTPEPLRLIEYRHVRQENLIALCLDEIRYEIFLQALVLNLESVVFSLELTGRFHKMLIQDAGGFLLVRQELTADDLLADTAGADGVEPTREDLDRQADHLILLAVSSSCCHHGHN